VLVVALISLSFVFLGLESQKAPFRRRWQTIKSRITC